MKYIISETQVESFDVQKNADILSKLFKIFYSDFIIHEHGDYLDTWSNEEKDELLFDFNSFTKVMTVGVWFLDKLFKKTNLFFLDYTTIKTNRRNEFNEIIKTFAKDNFGWDVKRVEIEFF